MSIFPFLRSLVAALLYPFLVVLITFLIVISGFWSPLRKLQDAIVGAWARISLFLFGVKIHGSHLERLPAGGYLAVFNHTSNFDILAVQSLIPHIRFGAKIELFKIPFFGWAMKASGALPIARSHREEVLKVYEVAKQRMLNGECFILSPEGTRQPVEKLGPFKSGPFLLAIAAQVPLVPIAIKGALNIQPKGKLLPNSQRWISIIDVEVGAPIFTQGFTDESRKELQTQLKEAFIGMGLS